MEQTVLDDAAARAISEAQVQHWMTTATDGHLLNHYAAALMTVHTLAVLALTLGTPDDSVLASNHKTLVDLADEVIETIKGFEASELKIMKDQLRTSMTTPAPIA